MCKSCWPMKRRCRPFLPLQPEGIAACGCLRVFQAARTGLTRCAIQPALERACNTSAGLSRHTSGVTIFKFLIFGMSKVAM